MIEYPTMIGMDGKPPFNLDRLLQDMKNGVEFEFIACPHMEREAATGFPTPGQMAEFTRGHYEGTGEQVVTVTCPACLLGMNS